MDADFIPKGSLSTFYNPLNSRDQRRQSKEERVDAEKNADILTKILERLDESISRYQSLESISDEVIADPTLLAQTIHANRLTVENLKQERGVIKDIIDDL